MAIDTYTRSFAEILTQVSKMKTKKEKVSFLRQYQTDALRMVCKSSFDPKIVWELPDGDVPYRENDAPEGTEHTQLHQEVRKLYHFIKGGNPQLTQNKRELMFVQMLEGLHKDEALLLVAAKDKKLHRKYKGLSDNVVKEAFDWDDDYRRIEQSDYPQSKGLAAG
jgi:hypothetical protein|tara:strand:+ start:338 stop:832 length:495 start_codon:yes stop_codon:yes gene_type:complete